PFREQRVQDVLARRDRPGRPTQVVPCHCEKPGAIVDLDPAVPAPPGGEPSLDQDVKPGARRGHLGVAGEPLYQFPRPWGDFASLGMAAVVQVEPAIRVVLAEYESNPREPARRLRLPGILEAAPRGRCVRARLDPVRLIWHFRQLAVAAHRPPADP